MINPTSRYASASVETVTNSTRGTIQDMVLPAPVEYSFNYTQYQMTYDDTIGNVAYEFLGDARLWWQIALANPEILYWQTIPMGTILRIPDVQS